MNIFSGGTARTLSGSRATSLFNGQRERHRMWLACPSNTGGFTLIELVMVIVIMGIISIGVSQFVGRAVGGYVDSSERNKLASAMVVASEKLSRELRRALPNSIRVGGDTVSSDNCVEFIPIVGGARYLSVPLGIGSTSIDAITLGNANPLTAFIAIYPISQNDLYSPTDLSPASMTASSATIPAGGGQISITLGASHQFRTHSPNNRLYAVDSPVSFCQPAGSDRIYRYSGYGFNNTAVLPPTGATRAVLIDDASVLSPIVFNYSSATRTRNAVVSFSLATNFDNEFLRLGQEVQIRNVP